MTPDPAPDDWLGDAWLGTGFHRSLGRVPGRIALSIGGRQISYAELAAIAGGVAAALGPEDGQGGDTPALTALLASRSVAAYAGILGILHTGHGYVPLNPGHPVERLAYVLGHSGAERLVVDTGGEAALDALLVDCRQPLRIVLADRDDVADFAARHPLHDFRPGHPEAPLPPPPAGPMGKRVAYLLYTSGSTGHPKGVMVTHGNVAHFLKAMADRFDLSQFDRFSQMFDLGFDLSVFDLFMAWRVGGTLCCPAAGEEMLPADFIRREALTVWFSVPSVAVLLNRLRQLEPGAFPGLRLSLFCGEAFPATAASAWARAAPNAIVENLYGPTELTLACTGHRVTGAEGQAGVVPIGLPFPGLTARVVTPDLAEVAPGEQGELMVSGPQVALGYWRDPQKTAAAFVTDPATGARAYLTGDLVVRPPIPEDPILYLGRLDHQIKLHGHRIELGEIEAALRDATGMVHVVAAGLPDATGAITGIAGYIEAPEIDPPRIMALLSARLPGYMLPKRLVAVRHFPLTPNGKIDRKGLAVLLKSP